MALINLMPTKLLKDDRLSSLGFCADLHRDNISSFRLTPQEGSKDRQNKT
jgi:hypothetical protein